MLLLFFYQGYASPYYSLHTAGPYLDYCIGWRAGTSVYLIYIGKGRSCQETHTGDKSAPEFDIAAERIVNCKVMEIGRLTSSANL